MNKSINQFDWIEWIVFIQIPVNQYSNKKSNKKITQNKDKIKNIISLNAFKFIIEYIILSSENQFYSFKRKQFLFLFSLIQLQF